MSFGDKLKFWKKHDDESFTFDSSYATSNLPPDPSMQSDTFGTNPQFQQDSFAAPSSFNDDSRSPFAEASAKYGQPSRDMSLSSGQQFFQGQNSANTYGSQQSPSSFQQPSQKPSMEHSMELLQAKLDAVRSELYVISQRLENMERKLGERQRF